MGPTMEEHFEACEARVRAWIQAGEEAEEGPWPPAPLEELTFWLRHGGELEEIPSLALLDEIAGLRRARIRRLERGADALAELRSALDAACLPGSGLSEGFPFRLKALIRPLEDEIDALGVLQHAIHVPEDAIGLFVAPGEGSEPLRESAKRAILASLRRSGADPRLTVICLPPGSRIAFRREGEPELEGRQEAAEGPIPFPAEASARLAEPREPPEAYSETTAEPGEQ